MAKGKIEIKMSDEEIMRCRESRESIQSIAAKNNVSFGTMQRIIKALETKKRRTAADGHRRRRCREFLHSNQH